MLMGIHVKNALIRRLLNFWVGPLLFCWLAFSIYTQVLQQPNLHQTISNISHAFNRPGEWRLWTIIALMLVNWSIEARKFQVLMQGTQQISWLKCLEAIFTGVAFAMNTPNRIGEYGGRVLYVDEPYRWKAVALTVIGSVSQLTITLIAGCGAIIYLLLHPLLLAHAEGSIFSKNILVIILCVVSTITFVCLFIFFRPGIVTQFAEKLTGNEKWLTPVSVLKTLHVRKLLRVFSLSTGRYVVFVFQSILMLQLLQVTVSFADAFWLMALIFLLLAIVPTIALAEIGVRGKISLAILGLVSANEFGIVAASTGIWLINLVLPALLGSLLILSVKIFDR